MFVDPDRENVTPIPWNLNGIPHIFNKPQRAISLSVGCDSRNHVLAARLLRTDIMKITPIVLLSSSKRFTHTVVIVWAQEGFHEDDVCSGFVPLKWSLGTASPIWGKAFIVKYATHAKQHPLERIPENILETVSLSDKECEARSLRALDIPPEIDAKACKWFHGRVGDFPRVAYSVSLSNGVFQIRDKLFTCDNLACRRMLGKGERKRCPCDKANYCGRECQKADWQRHKTLTACPHRKKKE